MTKAGARPLSFLRQPAKQSAGLFSRLSASQVPTFNENKEGLHLKCHKTLINDNITSTV